MNKVLFWFFFIVCLAAPPCQNAFASIPRSNSPLKQGKHLKPYGYGMFGTELSRQDHDRKRGKVHEAYVRDFSASKKGKSNYGGANDIKRPRNSRSASNSMLLKPNLFFSAALKHLAVGFFVCFMLTI